MTIGHRRPPWKRLPLALAVLAGLAAGASSRSGSRDTPLLERDDPARGGPRDDAEVTGRAAPPQFDLRRLTIRLAELDAGGAPEPVLEIEVATIPWSGEIETGARIQVFLDAGTAPPLELTLRYQEPLSVRRRPTGGAARLTGPPRLADLSAVLPGRGVVFRLPVADLPPAPGAERALRLWVLAVQGGSEDRLPDTDDGGPPDSEAEVLRVRLPAPEESPAQAPRK